MNRKHVLLWVKWFQDEREDITGDKGSICPKASFKQDCWKNMTFWKKILTSDKAWVFQYDPETNSQSLQ
jgi:hypothetical protein